jgi:hypothetical protein
MTEIGLCHNANKAYSCLTIDAAKAYRPRHARTITYWSDDHSYWRQTLAACRDLAQLGLTNLIIFNTEAYGGAVNDIDVMQDRLRAFLTLARDEYGTPVHGIEPLNEIDTPGWDDGAGNPITADLVLKYTYAAHAVATGEFAIETISPSFLGGPLTDLPVAVLSALKADPEARIKIATFHMYGRSIDGQPTPGWLWGSVEDGVNDLLTYIGDMQIDLTEGGCWTSPPEGPDGQRRFIRAFCAFDHPRVRRHYLFALNDWCPADKEYNAGKDFGLERRDGAAKPAAEAFDGGLKL